MQTAVVGTALASTAVSAYGSYQQGQTAQKVARNNQIMAEYAAQDATKRGEEDAIRVQQRGAQIKGAQRSRMAAAGLDLGAGTAQNLQDQTDFFTASDVATTRSNAARSAWSARASGDQAMAMGRNEAAQGNLSAFSTLLGGASQVAGKWNTYGSRPKVE